METIYDDDDGDGDGNGDDDDVDFRTINVSPEVNTESNGAFSSMSRRAGGY